MKIYTKKGDTGETALFGGSRVMKDNVRIEAYGTVDELNAMLGHLNDRLSEEQIQTVLPAIQERLFTIGSNLASDPSKQHLVKPDLNEADVQLLEDEIDQMNESLPELKNFILPGGHPLVSLAHIARTVCRRSERKIIALHGIEQVDTAILIYINRLSDYLFVLARFIAFTLKIDEIHWKPRG